MDNEGAIRIFNLSADVPRELTHLRRTARDFTVNGRSSGLAGVRTLAVRQGPACYKFDIIMILLDIVLTPNDIVHFRTTIIN